jgi:transcription elongation factor GreA
MSMTQYYFTEKGYQKLKDEIDKLERFIKHDISKEIAAARDHGDLKENAEYHAAKDKQAMYMAKLGQFQERFAKARIVRKEDLAPDIITLGKRVKIKEVNTGDEREYTILGEGETDIDNGIISYQSPLAKALMSHKQGDVVDVQLPREMKKFEILEIEFFEGD